MKALDQLQRVLLVLILVSLVAPMIVDLLHIVLPLAAAMFALTTVFKIVLRRVGQ